MTVSSSTALAGPFVADGVTRTWPFAFKALATADLVLLIDNGAGVITEVSSGSFSVTGLNLDAGGTITYPIAPTAPLVAPQLVTIERRIAYTQPTSVGNQGAFFPKVHETAWDRMVMMIQQVLGFAKSSLRAPTADGPVNLVLPAKNARANKVLGFDGNGLPVVAGNSSDLASIASGAAAATAAAAAAAASATTASNAVGSTAGNAATAVAAANAAAASAAAATAVFTGDTGTGGVKGAVPAPAAGDAAAGKFLSAGGGWSVPGGGGGSLDDATRRNILLNAIRMSKALGYRLPIINGLVDGFAAIDGINAGASSGYLFDLASRRIANGTSAPVANAAVDPVLNADGAGWSGYAIRQVIPAGSLAAAAGTKIRLTLTGPAAGNASNYSKTYVGHRGAGAYDFNGSQVKMTFGGLDTCVLTTGVTVVSDEVTFTYNPALDLVIAYDVSGVGLSDVRQNSSPPAGFNIAFKAAAAEAPNTTVSGYTASAGRTVSVDKVEMIAAGVTTNIVLVGTPLDQLDAQPSTLRLLVLMEPLETLTLASDLEFALGRDNGTTFSTTPLVDYHQVGQLIVAETAALSVTGQPAGLKPAARMKTLNGKRCNFHGYAIIGA